MSEALDAMHRAHRCGISIEAILSVMEDHGISPELWDVLYDTLNWYVEQCQREQRERCELGEIDCGHPHIDASPFVVQFSRRRSVA